MNIELGKQIVATYEKHGWNLRRVLIIPTDEGEERTVTEAFLNGAVSKAEIDAMWFARPSHGGREAWELRLVAEQPYALFETFEADEAEEDREEARREMEHKMREYAVKN
jgi:hypothetical protein